MRAFAIAFALCVLCAGLSFADTIPGHFFFNLNNGACTLDCSGGGWTHGQEFDPSLTDPSSGAYTSTFFCPNCFTLDPDIELDLGDASAPFDPSNAFFAGSNGGGFGSAIGADYFNNTAHTFTNVFLKILDFVPGEEYHCTLGAGFGADVSCGFKVDSVDSTILDVGFFNVDIPPAAVPEPASLPMISLMLVGVGSLMRRKVRSRS